MYKSLLDSPNLPSLTSRSVSFFLLPLSPAHSSGLSCFVNRTHFQYLWDPSRKEPGITGRLAGITGRLIVTKGERRNATTVLSDLDCLIQ